MLQLKSKRHNLDLSQGLLWPTYIKALEGWGYIALAADHLPSMSEALSIYTTPSQKNSTYTNGSISEQVTLPPILKAAAQVAPE